MKRPSLFLLVCACAGSACACRPAAAPEPERQPRYRTVELKEFNTPQSAPSLTVLSIPLPASSIDQWQVAIAQGAPESVRQLSDAEFAHIVQAHGRQGGAAAGGLHFATLHPGSAQVFLTNTRRVPLLTVRLLVNVQPRLRDSMPIVAAAPVWRWTSADQGEVHSVSYGDTIEITLPGSARDEWNTESADSAGVSLHRKRAAGPAMTRLVFHVSASGTGELVLSPRTPQAPTYRFRLEHHPVPMC